MVSGALTLVAGEVLPVVSVPVWVEGLLLVLLSMTEEILFSGVVLFSLPASLFLFSLPVGEVALFSSLLESPL